MRAICRIAGALAALAIVAAASTPYAQETKLTVPNVTVTAPPVAVQPPYLRDPWKSYERNPYAGRYRVEEDKFKEVPCNVTRIASSAGGVAFEPRRAFRHLWFDLSKSTCSQASLYRSLD
jgi:hypothetical protein